MANPPRAATIRGTVTQVEASAGPPLEQFCIPLDYPALFKWVPGDTTTVDHTSVLGHTGGTIGRWKMVAQNPPWLGETIITPGTNKGAEINLAIITASTLYSTDGVVRTIRLVPGIFYLETPIVMRNGVALRGAGSDRTQFIASTTPAVGLADDRTNCLLYAAGVEDTATLNTVLTDSITPGAVDWYGAGARHISVSSLGSIGDDDWIVVGGTDCTGQNPGGQSGANYQTRELLRVSTTATGPNRISLKWPTKQHHSIAVSGVGGTTPFVRAITPVVNIRIEGVSFTSTSHAVGCRFDDCVDVELDDIKFDGFSRSPIEVFGGLNHSGKRLVFRGSNGGLYLRSLNVGDFQFSTATDGNKTHTNGIHRPALWVEHACTFIRVHDSHVRNRVQAYSWRGVAGGCEMSDCVAEDIHRYAQTLPANTAGVIGAALCTGGGEGPDDEHAYGLTVRNFRCRSIYSAANAAGLVNINDIYEGAICHHDILDCNIDGVIEVGLGGSPTIDGDADYVTGGVISQDAGGRLSIRVLGAQYAFVFRSAGQQVVLENCEHYTTPNSGSSSSVSLLLYGANGLDVRNFYGQGYTWFTSGYGSQPAPYSPAFSGTYSMDGEVVHCPLRVCTFSGQSAENGEVWALDSTAAAGATKLKVPAADGDHIVVAHGRNNLSGWADGGFGLFGEVGQGKMLVSGAGNAGDTVDFSLGSTTASATGGTAIGARTIARLLENKGAGTALAKVARIR